MNTGPLTNAFNEDNEGVVLKEFIVYRVIDGNLTREKFVRQYHGNGESLYQCFLEAQYL